jgi:hypothetical protein
MFTRTSFRVLAIAALIVASCASWRAFAQSAQVPPGPAGGINPSKLPDVEGVHLGMTIDQVTAVLKTLAPPLTTYYSHYNNAPKWIARLQSGDPSDSVDVFFSVPPTQQQALLIQRRVMLPAGKQPTFDTIVNSLRQKYGKELSTRSGPALLAWAFDEQGQPVTPTGPSNWSPTDCAEAQIGVTGGQTAPGQPVEIDYILDPGPLDPQIPKLTSNLCNQHIFIRAQVDTSGTPEPTSMVNQVWVSITETPLMVRDGIAAQQYLNHIAASKQQQQINQAQQQKAPTL